MRKTLDPMWYAACCLAGQAGLRVGEIRTLDWKRDVDLVAGTLTVNRQARLGQTTTPKGRTRRTVPMTDTLLAALKALDTIRTGFVIRNLDGSGMADNETKYHCYRLCRVAGYRSEAGTSCGTASAQRGHDDPDRKVIAMLAARANCAQCGSNVAVKPGPPEENPLVLVT